MEMVCAHDSNSVKPGMEELMIWEQHTITLNKDPKMGFGFAISGGRDKPSPESGDTAIVVSDVLPNGPAMGRLFTKDNIVMVNGVSMENVFSNFTIQNLRSCGQTANVTVRRPRKIQLPASTRPTRAVSHSNLLDSDTLTRRPRRYSDGSDKGRSRQRARSNTPDRNGHSNTLPLMNTSYKRLPNNDVAEKPIKATLLKKKLNDEYGLKLGSQIFIKHMTDTGLAAKEGTLQEGDLILKINGMTTENLSLLETKHLVEKSRGRLTMTVLRDSRKFLVSIPEVVDSAPNSEEDRRHDSSSELEDISDLDMDMPSPKERVSRHPTRERTARRTRTQVPPPAKSRDSSPVRSTLTRPAARPPSSRRALSESESDHSPSPPPPTRRGDTIDTRDKYKSLSGLSMLPDPRSSPMAQKWAPPRTTSAASKPRKPVSESDSDRSVSPPRLRQESPRPNSRYKVLPDLPLPVMRASPINVRQEPLRRVSSPVRAPPPDSESESDESTNYPARQGTHYNQDSRDKYRVLPELATAVAPKVAPKLAPKPRSWSPPSAGAFPTSLQKPASDSESDVSYSSVPQRRGSSESGGSHMLQERYRVLPETQAAPLRHTASKTSAASRPTQDDSSGSDQLRHLRRSGSSEPGSHHGPRPSKSGTSKSGVSGKNKPVSSKPVEEPLYSLPPDSYPTPNVGYSSDLHTVSFIKDGSIGLRLVGGNDVGIFVGGVQPSSPAQEQGMREGRDQIMQVNKVDFNHFTREEAANYLLHIKHGEPVEICTQNKMHLYKKILKSSLGDNFYVRTHFDHEADTPVGLSFTRGEVFRVVDTMHRGKLGNWLAIRMGNDLHELDKGTIPHQAKAETLAVMEQAQRASGERQASGPRAEFWKLRGLRGAKKNVRRNRDDLLQLTIQGKFPAYEKVLLREANFKRPIVILGPLNDIAMEKLAKEMPDEYEVAEMVPRSGGGDSASTVIKLDTVRAIAEKDKHPLLDITPTAVERLNYIQYHPMVLFLDPHSRKDIKAMRLKYSPNSNKSSRRLYTQSLKIRKHCSHLFSARVDLQPSSNVWYDILKDKIRHQQAKPVWVSEVTLESGAEQDLDTLDQSHSDYLSAASDLEDTDGEPFTDGEIYTDNEDLDEAFPGQGAAAAAAAKIQRGRGTTSALARSSEPAHESLSDLEPVPEAETYSLREVPPLMHVHVPEPRHVHHEEDEEEEDDRSSPRRAESTSPQDNHSHRSWSGSDASDAEPAGRGTPAVSEGPPDFVAPDPTGRGAGPMEDEGRESDPERESPPPASLSLIEEKLQQARQAEPQEKKSSPAFIVLAHHQALQYRRTQIRGSDSSNEEEEADDVEWGPATEL
ncbi:tight junction protein ZO-3 isoform X2 [Gadus chalcogrammus]|uniref:tight junction protein ZO-3 isoform X2 n=1 Tax=Gadus chalcogrammus TaxID=1042646 RepID=UPI0024C49B9B|nr:tight junction protein ZO-3 isoform X2 [Gadus chalcogrammus]